MFLNSSKIQNRQWQEEVEKLFEKEYPNLLRKAYRMLNDEMLAEDLVQDVFFKFWKQKQSADSAKAYLGKMLFNEIISYWRKQKVDLEFNETAFIDEDSEVDKEEAMLKLDEFIAALPPKCRMIFTMSRFDEMSYKEIAQELDISVKTVENQMGKAFKILREQVKSLDNLYLLYFL